MYVLDKKKINKTIHLTKVKTAKLKEDLGDFVARSPLFRMLKEKALLFINNPQELNDQITRFFEEKLGESGRKTMADFWSKLKLVFNMVKDSINNKYTELPKAKIIVGIAVLLYTILPADIFPDALPVLGFADDAALIAWFMRHAAKEIKHYENWSFAH